MDLYDWSTPSELPGLGVVPLAARVAYRTTSIIFEFEGSGLRNCEALKSMFTAFLAAREQELPRPATGPNFRISRRL